MTRDVLFPRGCAGCDAPDEVLCGRCAARLRSPERFALPGSSSGFGMACGSYRGPVRTAILSWKDHGDTECDGPFALALTELCAHGDLTDVFGPLDAVTLVPAPSSPASVLRRGRRQLDPLLHALDGELSKRGIRTSIAWMLGMARMRGRSVQTSSARDRERRVSGHLMVRGSHPGADRSVPLVLVDDIVTSGATLRQCVSALRRKGFTVAPALTLARTPRRGEPSGPSPQTDHFSSPSASLG